VDWQVLTVWLLGTAAAAYLSYLMWRSWRKSQSGCGGSCGCSAQALAQSKSDGHAALVRAEELTARLRHAMTANLAENDDQ
jgi:hypothetical protein